MKKLLIILMCIAIIAVSSLGTATGFAFSQTTAKDIDEHWAEDAITRLKNLEVMNGFEGYTNPDNIVTRGEFTALITRAFGMESGPDSKTFADIGTDHMFYSAIAAASNAGIVDGFNDNTFRPDNMITREEIMLIISRLTDREPASVANFWDIGSDYLYIRQLSKVSEDGIIGGYPDGSFKPYNKTTRAEAATMIVSALNKYIPQGNLDDICAFTHSYLNLHFSDIAAAQANSIGDAANNIEYIRNTYNVVGNLGYYVVNTISDINFLTYSQNGPVTKFLIEYNITRDMSGSVKSYKGQSDISVITRNDVNKVFEHNTRIVNPEFINLTWEVYSKAPSYVTEGVNAVSPTSFRIEAKPAGNALPIYTESNTLYFNSSLTNEYLNYAKSNGYNVWVMYKTDFTLETANAFLNSNQARKQANDILIKQILQNDLDGINFDFEHMNKTDKGAYTNHVKEISIMAHTLGAVVSVDVTKYERTSSTWSMCYDRDALAKYADYIMLMAYDQYYSASKTPGPVAGLGWTESCITLTLKEVPADKLVLGMPYYIRIWKTQNGKSISSKAVSMSEALNQIQANGANGQYDSTFGLTKYSWSEGEYINMLWLENAESIRARVKLAEKYSLAGVASWRRGFETYDVWQTIKAELAN